MMAQIVSQRHRKIFDRRARGLFGQRARCVSLIEMGQVGCDINQDRPAQIGILDIAHAEISIFKVHAGHIDPLKIGPHVGLPFIVASLKIAIIGDFGDATMKGVYMSYIFKGSGYVRREAA